MAIKAITFHFGTLLWIICIIRIKKDADINPIYRNDNLNSEAIRSQCRIVYADCLKLLAPPTSNDSLFTKHMRELLPIYLSVK